MSRGDAGLFVSYCAKDFLDGTQLLSPWEELAYRRICDLIYVTGDRLPDDDQKLAWMTKTGRRWPAIKIALTAGERPKLIVIEGRITNFRCQSALGSAAKKMAQKATAGNASAGTGKSLKNLKQNRTDVRYDVRQAVRNGDRTEDRTNHQPLTTEEERDTPAAGAGPVATRARRASSYAFEGKVIRLTPEDFEAWRTTFSAIPDLRAELATIDIWLLERGFTDSKWFHRAAGMLNRKHQESLAKQAADKVWAQRDIAERYPNEGVFH